MEELIKFKKRGQKAAVVFIIMREDADFFLLMMKWILYLEILYGKLKIQELKYMPINAQSIRKEFLMAVKFPLGLIYYRI